MKNNRNKILNIDKSQLNSNQLLKLDNRRHYQVRAQNALIQKTSAQLTTGERKLILHLIQMINKNTSNLKFKFNIPDYAKFLGIKVNNTNVSYIKSQIKHLADKSFWYRTTNVDKSNPSKKYDVLIRWFSHAAYSVSDHEFIIQFDQRLKPFLLNVKSHFTSFDYYNVIDMNKTYSIKLYEILVSHYNQQNIIYGYKYSLKNLRFSLGIGNKYKRFCDFNRRVIKPAVQEINDKTEFSVYSMPIKKSRRTIGIRFLLRRKGIKNRNKTKHLVDKHLMGQQKSYQRGQKLSKKLHLTFDKSLKNISRMDSLIETADMSTLREYLKEYRHHELPLDKHEFKLLEKAIIDKF